MPYNVTLEPNGVRGSKCQRAIALTWAGPPGPDGKATRIPMSAAAVAQLQAGYSLIRAQFKLAPTDPVPLIDLSSDRGEITVEPAYPRWDGTTIPAIVLHFTGLHTHFVIEECVWDMDFSNPGEDPETWCGGVWGIDQDVTDSVPAP